MNELALFAGAGGGILGGHLLGWRTVCAVEWEPYPASVLVARQNDKILPPFPIWDDVQTFDGKPWRGIVDVVSGGFPCQDISSAGGGAGITGSRSSMWKHMARIIGEVRPQYAFIENSPMLTIRGLETVLCDLAALGFDAKWGVVSAADVGAPHLRERIWIRAEQRNFFSHANDRGIRRGEQQSESTQETHGKLADTNSSQCKGSGISIGIPPKNANISGYGGAAEVSNTDSLRQSGSGEYEQSFNSTPDCDRETNNAESIGGQKFWPTEPAVGRVANGVAARMDRLKAIGNGQVPRVAATAWRLLNE